MNDARFVARWIALSFCLLVSFTAGAADEESIVVDSNGDYIFTYKSYLGWQKVKWIPATKINPVVKGVVRPIEGKDNNLAYRYTLRNGKDSRQFLVGMRLSASNVLSSDPYKPVGWAGHATLDHGAGTGFIVGWFFRRYDGPWEAGLKPGASAVTGFGFDSKDLPGTGKIALWAAVPPGQSFPDEGPNEGPIRDEFNRILNNNFVTRIGAVPRISVPVPYDAAAVLAGIQQHIKTDLLSMQLIDPVFAAQLDPWFASAIDAAKRNNTEGLRHAIKELRRLLKQEHADVDKEDESDDFEDDKKTKPAGRIDKLAARVLDFDLNYVEKRLEEKK